jgi:MYXO-CTERM domain-containing protein
MQPLRSLSGGIFLLGLLGASPALAHVDLLEPEARAHGTAAGATADDVNTNQKTAPCGQVTNGRTDRVTTYAPGQTITLRVAEETPHESYIRVSLDLDGDTFPLRPQVSTPAETEEVALAAEQALGGDTLLGVFRETNNTANFVHEIEVTLPNQTCTNCTLQVIQFMYGAGNPFYFQCADLVISGDAAAGGGADAGADPVPATPNTGAVAPQGAGGSLGSVPAPGDSTGSGGASGAPTGLVAPGTGGSSVAGAAGSQSAGAGGGSTSGDDEEDDGGCSLPASGTGSNGTGLFAVLALGLALLRRRS